VWWFGRLDGLVRNHMIAVDGPSIPTHWLGRAMLCTPLEMLPVEAVARGYLTGSGLIDYRSTGAVCGVALPPGLTDGDRLPEPIFTPATKADLGEHDENVSFDAVADTVGRQTAEQLRKLTLAIYVKAAEIAAERGIILADTKFEFGHDRASGELVLADEVLTPDSSRFWPADSWAPGRAQPSFDKQYVRNWLLSEESGWDRASDTPPPPLPAEVVAATRARYIEAYERLTGLRFADWPAPV
jgi:phosphoribosylaminoimidazole-succinocarboxamide synthase